MPMMILLPPSRSALDDKLDNAAMLSADLNLKFNLTKCQLLHFQPRPQGHLDGVSVTFCEQHVYLSTSALHRGHYIGHDYYSETMCRVVNDLNRRTNCLSSKSGHCTCDTKYRLFKAHCMTAYGSALWNFDHPSIENFLLYLSAAVHYARVPNSWRF